jgi:excisionase family DNA binding protein
MLKSMLVREYLSVTQAANYLGINRQKVYSWCRGDNKIDGVTMDDKGHWCLPKDEIEKMLKK